MATKEMIDYGAGAAAMASPIWVHYLDLVFQAGTFIGGFCLVVIRIGIALEERRRKRA